MAFPEPLPEHVLDGLTDEELIAYIAAMRSRGNAEAAATGLGVLVFGHWENVRRRVALRVPAVEVEDLTGEIITSAVRSAFDGTSEGEFIVWLGTIVKRRIADFYRLRERRLDTDSLDAIAEGGREPATDGEIDLGGYLEVQAVIVELLEARSEAHRRVIEIMVFDDLPASAAVAEVDGMTAANAYQVVTRFRAELRRRLAERDTDADPA